MPRGRGVKRSIRQINTESYSVAASDEDMEELANQPKNLIPSDASSRSQNHEIAENEEEYFDDTLGNLNSIKRLTEGDIDVDDADSESAEEEQIEEESEDNLTPAEKAAQICRLSASELCADELSLFPFLETSPRLLKESYLIVRNLACLLWSEDSCVQVTTNRLVPYVINNMSSENLRVMIECGLTAPVPVNQSDNAIPSCDELLINRNKSNRVESGRSIQRHLASLALPTNYSPWGTSVAKANLERMCYLVVLLLERYGYINYGVFKVLSLPLTHTSLCENTDVQQQELSPTKRTASTDKLTTRRSASGSASTTTPSSSSHQPLRVIVIGGGISGLIAARQLIYFGVKVILLESRDRVGGRIWTYKKNAISFDLGAMVVTGLSANPISVLAKQLSLTFIPLNTECVLHDPKGRLVPRELDEQVEEEFNRILGTAAYLCHVKGLDSYAGLHRIKQSDDYNNNNNNNEKDEDENNNHNNNNNNNTQSDEGLPLSLGQVIEWLVKYQEKHIIELKITHHQLINQLLDRKNDILEKISVIRKHIEVAYDNWHQASLIANRSALARSNNNNNNNNSNNNNKRTELESNNTNSHPNSPPHFVSTSSNGVSGGGGGGSSNNKADNQSSTIENKSVGKSINATTNSPDSNNNSSSSSSSGGAAGGGNTLDTTTVMANVLSSSSTVPIFNVSSQFEVRRLLSQLHEVWKQFQPLQQALCRVNKQLDILMNEKPKDKYLTEYERCLLDWHLANLEFANATELTNLSLKHWDQDDLFELTGNHCVLQHGYGNLIQKLAHSIHDGDWNSPPTSPLSHNTSSGNTTAAAATTVNSAPPEASLSLHQTGSGHIELKTSVKRISYNQKGVRVDVLNSALSQEDLIEYESDVVLCTLPLGILKESIKNEGDGNDDDDNKRRQGDNLTKINAPQFIPPLPDWKCAAIQRLGFGLLNKVVLIFEKSFWDRSQNLFGYVNPVKESRGELFLFWSISDKPVLVALVAGRAATEYETKKDNHHLSPVAAPPSSSASASSRSTLNSSSLIGRGVKEPIVQRALQILRSIFTQDSSNNNNNTHTSNNINNNNLNSNDNLSNTSTHNNNNNNDNNCNNNNPSQSASDKRKVLPSLVDAFVTRWYSDPDSRGSYSYVAVGSSGADYDILGQPVGLDTPIKVENDKIGSTKGSGVSHNMNHPRLFFAGEHTCRNYPATVHGALLSGLRESARIANLYFPGQTPVKEHGFKLNPPSSR